ncbi:aldehyde dehydrogenase family protein [Streptomyces sp. NBC_00257]|uniref:aldehyde dehydrogenase family protein n=1 Tax=unclassified Streptomyces TaxID=2593676 RepID=UPI00224D46E4|nr:MULTISPECIES: aldehyde dehydrogenase family protein [unclassified Streptomyces]MCX4398707.1 aldehyde dehydrogenase family protein [Streptomyces sp. NBC_01767]MCX4870971.1 aldehyde dehydrogenase family protein [Streptomyces sp. NBC_00906]MCX4901710.1 aldehyde dehydrogenase family protein [Streptomyces sp. NBC_00892]MCX5426952.1 aldehyde dehydrogenase family protein [Streptomyces sp. NBC_00062]WSP51003.1 aldehyde dehydrogenase family protein [Streptomyces sp. NBC_01243]
MTPKLTESPVWDGKLYSDGWREGSGEKIAVIAPGSDKAVGQVSSATQADLDTAVASAKSAQRAWAKASYTQRAAVMLKAAALLAADPARLQDVLVPESGSAMGKAGFEVGLVVSELQECAALASHPNGEILRSVKPRLSLARRVPLGVVGVIAPFNFPAVLAMRSVAPALALGNAVILKPDPRTPVSGGLALAELLAEAGLPDGVLHVLPGGGDLGAALVSHPDVPCISFTGSTAAGRKIGEAAASLLKRVHLELGGNNATLVMPDADVQAAASVGAWGSFLHQGQICMTTGRHLVHRSLADEYVAALCEKAENLRVGDPSDASNALGPLIDTRQRDRVHSVVTGAVAKGATLTAGGSYDGLYYRPTVLTDVTSDNLAWSEEIFGPVAPIQVYDDVDEAIEIIDASEYGLSVSILTSNTYAAFELSDRIDAGAVHINDSTVDDEAVAPFGGWKGSGAGGRFGGPNANIETFTETQWVTLQSGIERYPF